MGGNNDIPLLPGQISIGATAGGAALPPSAELAAAPEPEERELEAALRPKNLDDFVGQERVRKQLALVLAASRIRGRSADHVLMSGPPGLGKTTLAMIIAAEMNAPLRISSGPAIQHAGDLAAILSSLTEGEVLFLDEIHRMSRPAEEMLYMAMEDFRVDIIVGKGAGATAIPLELPPFTLVGATTRAGLLPGPLRDRFGFTGHLEFYSVAELELVLRRSAGMLDLKLSSAGFAEIAGRSRGTPRIANRLLRRVRDWALVHGIETIDARTASAALDMYEVDARGLDRLDRSVLEALVGKFNGGPVGLSTLAIAVGEEPETVETVAEPFLVREGLLGRTPRGRIAMPAAWDHLGLKMPGNAVAAAMLPFDEDDRDD
ncbi:Holliday junction branch migration DNA helicase RuvB [Arthrobacter sp. ERGS1:01]|uniref:Holliday junction branch migration DNA helicase RuvB n=1 Tax=Arthrobacter sp. ERGS1:01 TaxID=1704044 RepID=UPI000A47F6DB|nr:Holliday junction branch migration DNA helicase RuvB [Arthrobacter sp. ERGS1:01]